MRDDDAADNRRRAIHRIDAASQACTARLAGMRIASRSRCDAQAASHALHAAMQRWLVDDAMQRCDDDANACIFGCTRDACFV
jgi:hypothetical protein